MAHDPASLVLFACLRGADTTPIAFTGVIPLGRGSHRASKAEDGARSLTDGAQPRRRKFVATGRMDRGGGFLVVAIALDMVRYLEPRAEARALTATILPPENTAFELTNGLGLPALSPDGSKIVFGARTADGKAPLWVRRLDSAATQPIAGTDGAMFPFWSPDSRSIGFFADGKLKRIEASGGPALTIADAPLPRGGSWGRSGTIAFAPSNVVGLHRVSASGGSSSPLAEPGSRFPWFLPDGTHFLYQAQAGTTDREVTIRVASLDGGAGADLFRANSNAIYVRDHILFLRENTLMAQAFDLRRMKTTGDAVPVAENVTSVLNSRTAGVFSAAQSERPHEQEVHPEKDTPVV